MCFYSMSTHDAEIVSLEDVLNNFYITTSLNYVIQEIMIRLLHCENGTTTKHQRTRESCTDIHKRRSNRILRLPSHCYRSITCRPCVRPPFSAATRALTATWNLPSSLLTLRQAIATQYTVPPLTHPLPSRNQRCIIDATVFLLSSTPYLLL